MKQSKPVTITGWVITIGVAGMMLLSATMKFIQPEGFDEGWTTFGYPDSTIIPIAIAELVCVVIYLIPRTAPLGAILLTGYLGGAIATHVRVEDQFIMPAALGVAAWAALYLRDHRVRHLVSILKPLSTNTD